MNTRRPAQRHRNLPLLLLQARERVMSRFRVHLNQHGVTEQQWRVMRALEQDGPLEPRQLVDICCISSPSMAGVLARLHDLGWVDRQRMAEDQRRVSVTLTRSGQALVEGIQPLSEATYQELEDLLGRKFVADLYQQLDRLLELLPPIGSDDPGT